MIPAIGYMIGAYVILRCVEMLSLSNDRFESQKGRSVVHIMAILVMLWTGLMLLLLLGSEFSA